MAKLACISTVYSDTAFEEEGASLLLSRVILNFFGL